MKHYKKEEDVVEVVQEKIDQSISQANGQSISQAICPSIELYSVRKKRKEIKAIRVFH